jgi:hypothetical protein
MNRTTAALAAALLAAACPGNVRAQLGLPDPIQAAVNNWEAKSRILDDQFFAMAAKAEGENTIAKMIENCKTQPQPAIGMTRQQALSSSWGKPDSFSETVTADGTTQRWYYNNLFDWTACEYIGFYGHSYVLVFRNDRLVAIER